jgi:hypothetical protein
MREKQAPKPRKSPKCRDFLATSGRCAAYIPRKKQTQGILRGNLRMRTRQQPSKPLFSTLFGKRA